MMGIMKKNLVSQSGSVKLACSIFLCLSGTFVEAQNAAVNLEGALATHDRVINRTTEIEARG